MLVEINVESLNRLLILRVNQRLHMLSQFVYYEIENKKRLYDIDYRFYQSFEQLIIEWKNELNAIDHMLNTTCLSEVIKSLNKLMTEIVVISKVIALYTFHLLAIYNDLGDIVLIIERYMKTGELLICDAD